MPRITSTIDAFDLKNIGALLVAEPIEEALPAKSAFAIRRILVVCLGNICRSPMAEFILRKHLAERDVDIESAGIAATNGARIDPRALAALERHGIDADRHVARRLDRAMIDAVDLVLVMERTQLEFICERIPSATGKTFLFGKWQGGFEIPDPFGKPRETFDHLYRTLDIAARHWCELI